MLVCTASQMREIDRTAIEDYGVPGVVLMESAGRGVVDVICGLLSPRKAAVVVLCGSGNNGGDGFVVARHLIARGARVITYLVAERTKIAGDALVNLQILEKMGADICALCTGADLEREEGEITGADVVVDALLGTGLSSDVRGQYRAVLDLANRSGGLKIAVDIPSGLNSDTGQMMGAVFSADHTVTFAYPKMGLIVYPGVEWVGQLHVVDIGVPPGIEEKKEFAAELLDIENVRPRLRSRPTWGHKGTYGHLLVIAGSPGKTGAALLCGEAALRSGVGLCTIAAPVSAMRALEEKTKETMLVPLVQEDQELDGSDEVFNHLKQLFHGKSALAMGPGIPRVPRVAEFVGRLIRETPVPVVVDAD
ncbi:MAG: NAD(P)H-hydrate epimerase, partial [Pseudomonadota bacterium]